MKKLFTTITMLVMATLLIGQTEEDLQKKITLSSFMGLQFGSQLYLTKDEMIQAYPFLESQPINLNKKPKISKDMLSAKWEAKKSKLGNTTVNIYLYFNKLTIEDTYIFTRVEITFDSEKFDDLKDMFITKYGEPDKTQTTENVEDGVKSPISQSLRWVLKDTNLKITAEEYGYRESLQKLADLFGSRLEKKLNENQNWRGRIIIEVVSNNTETIF